MNIKPFGNRTIKVELAIDSSFCTEFELGGSRRNPSRSRRLVVFAHMGNGFKMVWGGPVYGRVPACRSQSDYRR